LRTRFNLAVLYGESGRYEEAEHEYLRTMESWERQFGSSSTLVVMGSHNLGFLYHLQGRYEEAEAYRRRALESSLRSLGANAPETVGRMHTLAATLSRKGDHAEAESLFVEALEVARRNDDAGGETRSHLGLAQLNMLRGDAARADSHFKHVLEHLDDIGEPYDHTALAAYYVFAGNHEMAMRALKKAVAAGYPRCHIASNPDFAPLRDNAEFGALVVDPNG
jgi:Tfp pilus assembly protein PilF